jgi:hypothetical protein
MPMNDATSTEIRNFYNDFPKIIDHIINGYIFKNKYTRQISKQIINWAMQAKTIVDYPYYTDWIRAQLNGRKRMCDLTKRERDMYSSAYSKCFKADEFLRKALGCDIAEGNSYERRKAHLDSLIKCMPMFKVSKYKKTRKQKKP